MASILDLTTSDDGGNAYEERLRFEELFGHPPDADEDEIVDFVRDRWEEQDMAMWERFHRWAYNIRFAAGDQWLISTDARTWFTPPAPSRQVRITNNLTWKALQYRISKLTESRPIGKVIPHSNEVSDADRAEAAQQYVYHQDRALDMGAVYDEALWYDALCGVGFIYTGYETETGEFIAAKRAEVVMGEDGLPTAREFFVNADGEEVDEEGAFRYRSGDVSCQVVPPWALRVSDPTEPSWKRQRWVIWGAIEEVSEIKRRFGRVADDVTGGDEYNAFVYYEDLVSGWSSDGYMRRPKERQNVPRALVLQFFERPSEQFPQGRHIVVCGRELLHVGPLPFGNEKIGYDLPFDMIRTELRLKDFYGRAPIEDMIPVQKRINQLESHAIEYIRLFTRGGIAAQYGTLIEESWQEGYGSILYFTGERPTPLSWPGMPADVWEALKRAYENFDRIAGWADVARGDVPPGVKAAKAILELKRSNDTPLGKALERFDRLVECVTEKLIKRAIWGYSEPHWINVLGADAPHLVRSVSAEDFPTEFTVKVETDSLLRLSYPAKLELLFELADRGWIDSASAMRLLNFADWEHRSGQWNRDYSMARLKIELLLAGQAAEVQWYEDDPVHMMAIEERLKDPRFTSLEPWQKTALTQLWLAHYQQWTMKQQGQLPPQLMQQMGLASAPNPALAMPGRAQLGEGSQAQPAAPGSPLAARTRAALGGELTSQGDGGGFPAQKESSLAA